MKPRMMKWSCRRCGSAWETVISEQPKPGQQDEKMASICEACQNRMAGSIVASRPVRRVNRITGEADT